MFRLLWSNLNTKQVDMKPVSLLTVNLWQQLMLNQPHDHHLSQVENMVMGLVVRTVYCSCLESALMVSLAKQRAYALTCTQRGACPT